MYSLALLFRCSGVRTSVLGGSLPPSTDVHMVSKISFKGLDFSVPNHIGMSVFSHISFIAVGLAPADFKRLLAPGPSVAQLHFPAYTRGMTFPANAASSSKPEPLSHRSAGIFLFVAVLMGLTHRCKQICNGGWGVLT